MPSDCSFIDFTAILCLVFIILIVHSMKVRKLGDHAMRYRNGYSVLNVVSLID